MIKRNDDHCKMIEYWSKAILRLMPDAELIIHYSNPPMERFRFNPCVGDWAKAEATSIYTKDGPIFVMDVDSLLIRPFEYTPKDPKIVLSMAASDDCTIFPGDPRPSLWEIGQRSGLFKPGEKIDVNPQFFWTSINLLPYFNEADDLMHKFNPPEKPFPDSLHGIGVWSYVWTKLRNEGKAEKFPQPQPVWHCPMPPGNRLEIFKKFYEYITNQPIDSPKPVPSEWLNQWT